MAIEEPNPYESPREVDRHPKRRMLGLVLAFMLLIPSGCICGGLTCYSVGGGGGGGTELLGMLLGSLLMAIIWIFGGLNILKRRT